MERVIKVYNPDNLKTIDYWSLEDFQGELKQMNYINLDKLKKSILRYGIFIPKFVWKHNGKYYVLDGHQTKKALHRLEREGYTIPKIPIVQIMAKGEKEAREKLLIINSKYGEITKRGIKGFIEGLKIDQDMITIDLNIEVEKDNPEVEFSEELLENNNYVVLYFTNEMDWLKAQTIFGLKKVRSKHKTLVQSGIGRVIKGADWIDRIK